MEFVLTEANELAPKPANAPWEVADGNAVGGRIEVIAELAELVSKGQLEVTIAAVYPLAEVRAAYRELAGGHTRGKIVLVP